MVKLSSFPKPDLLSLVCPGMRLPILWEKIANRCEEEGLHLNHIVDVDAEYRTAHLSSTHGLCVISWNALLNVLRREAETRGHNMFLGDINQLSGLCSRMDTEAFLPLHPQDISLEIGRRVQNFADFVDLIVAELAAHHGADLKGLTTGGSQSEYGRYFRLLGFGMFIAYSPRLWARYGETPIWLSVKEIADDEWSITRRVTEGLGQLPPGKFRHVPETESPNTIGIELPLGIEQPDVIAAVIEQVKEVAECCVRWQPNTRKI